MRALFFDTETTGLPLFNDPSEDPRQPHIVQLAAKLVDTDTRKVLGQFEVIIEPKGWVIPDDVAAIHGITTAHAAAFGVDEVLAVRLLLNLWDCCDERIAHNEPFDARILRIAMKRYEAELLKGYDPDEWKGAPAQCTQRLSSPILNLPPTPKMVAAKRMHAKSPNLSEAFEFFTGRKLENAHTALADVDACMAVWFAIKDRGNPNEPPR